MKPYRPSNGTEGDYFMEDFCFQCAKDNGEDLLCDILADTFCYDVDHRLYPKQWVQEDDYTNPRCTAFEQRVNNE